MYYLFYSCYEIVDVKIILQKIPMSDENSVQSTYLQKLGQIGKDNFVLSRKRRDNINIVLIHCLSRIIWYTLIRSMTQIMSHGDYLYLHLLVLSRPQQTFELLPLNCQRSPFLVSFEWLSKVRAITFVFPLKFKGLSK